MQEPLPRQAFHRNKYTGSNETVLYGIGGGPIWLVPGVYLAFAVEWLVLSALETSKALKHFDLYARTRFLKPATDDALKIEIGD